MCILNLLFNFVVFFTFLFSSPTNSAFFRWPYILFNACIKYELKLVASDSLNENQTTIVINVRDVNDLPPRFPQTSYERTLDEGMTDTPFTIMQVAILFTIPESCT